MFGQFSSHAFLKLPQFEGFAIFISQLVAGLDDLVDEIEQKEDGENCQNKRADAHRDNLGSNFDVKKAAARTDEKHDRVEDDR